MMRIALLCVGCAASVPACTQASPITASGQEPVVAADATVGPGGVPPTGPSARAAVAGDTAAASTTSALGSATLDAAEPDAGGPANVVALDAGLAPVAEPCPPAPKMAGFEECEAVEVTGAPPCETICRRPRRGATTRCCPEPVDVVVFGGKRPLLAVAACDFVPPECAHSHGHGNMDSRLRFLDGPPPEIYVVEGGCEMRAVMHGYVPPGVSPASGCRRQHYLWNGTTFVKRPPE